MDTRRTLFCALPLAGLIVAGCSTTATRADPPAWTTGPSLATPAAATRLVEVYKSPACGCCHEWEAYLRAHGYTVVSIPTEDMASIKDAHGIPKAAGSCHTALVEGYFVEGHVPIAAIEDLLEQRPAIDGIALPGMPAGSPGMGGDQAGAFEVLAVSDGRTHAFGAY